MPRLQRDLTSFNTTHIQKPKGVTRCRFHVVAVIQGGEVILKLSIPRALSIDFDYSSIDL